MLPTMVQDGVNPLLSVQHPIAFDQVRASHVEPAFDALLKEARERIAALAEGDGPLTYEATLGALESITERVGRVIRVVGHLESVVTTPELRAAYTAVQPKVSEFFSSIPMNPGLFRRLKAYAETDEAKSLDPTRARHLEQELDYFRREGAELDSAGKARLSELNVALTEITTTFSQHVLDATNAFDLVIEDRARLAGLPERAIAAAKMSAEDKGVSGYRFTLQAPSFIPVLTHLDDATLRERMYRAYNTRAASGEHDNRDLVEQILKLRQEKAALLGYGTFADLVTVRRMAKTGQAARDFIDGLRDRSQAAFDAENAELDAFRKALEGPGAAPLASWDIAYYAEKQRKERFDFDEEALRPYFPLHNVLTGLFDLCERLYGIRVTETTDVPTWHETVSAYAVKDADGSQLGVFYADLFPRETKRDGAWMNGFITGQPMGEQAFGPHVGLICANLTPAVGDTPALLAHREVETVFHEFGHLLHHMLTRVPVQSLAGTNVAWDFVELPSQIMENFCWERASLDLFARHHETGETIPDVLFERMTRARTYRGANAMMRQLGFASLDLAMHMDRGPALVAGTADGDILAYARKVSQPFAAAPLIDDYAMVLGFGHLFADAVGYAGGYYSYKWAEVLDADAFSRFREGGLFSREVGMAFRDTILARGDSRDPMDLFVEFMGRAPEQQALLERAGIR